jgi:hypothetical protein
MLLTTTPSERIGPCTRMRRFFVRFNGWESFVRTRSSAGFTIITSGFEFSVHTTIRAIRSAEEQEPIVPVFRQPTKDTMIKKSTTIAIAVASVLLLPVSAFAQGTGAAGATAGGAASGNAVGTPNAGSAGAGTTGVSGIPAGPASVGGN